MQKHEPRPALLRLRRSDVGDPGRWQASARGQPVTGAKIRYPVPPFRTFTFLKCVFADFISCAGSINDTFGSVKPSRHECIINQRPF